MEDIVHLFFPLRLKQNNRSVTCIEDKNGGRQVDHDPVKQVAGKWVDAPSLRALSRATATVHLKLFRENTGNLFSFKVN